MEIFRANLWEIKKSGSLRTMGGLLALFHVLQFYLWAKDGNLPVKFVQQGMPMCWSMMESCDWLHIFPAELLTGIFYLYAVMVILAALCFLLSDLTALGYYFLMAGLGLSLILYFQDLRLSSNEGYFIALASFSYLIIPAKHRLMRWLIVSFLAARGLSQASPDWLTGNWYIEHLALPVKLGEWLAAVSVLVQMIGGAALIFRDGRYFWSGWLALFAFECMHLYIGELMSSCLALGMLVYVALDELELRKAEREYLYQSFIRPEPSFAIAGTLLALFWAAQLSPFFHLGPGSRLKSALDVFALHPEAAHEECDQRTFAIYKDRTEEVNVEAQIKGQPAMACNPYLRFLDLKAMCKELQEKDAGFVTLSSVLQVRNFREKLAYRAFEVADFCDPNVTFKKLGEVKWTTTLAR